MHSIPDVILFWNFSSVWIIIMKTIGMNVLFFTIIHMYLTIIFRICRCLWKNSARKINRTHLDILALHIISLWDQVWIIKCIILIDQDRPLFIQYLWTWAFLVLRWKGICLQCRRSSVFDWGRSSPREWQPTISYSCLRTVDGEAQTKVHGSQIVGHNWSIITFYSILNCLYINFSWLEQGSGNFFRHSRK